MCAELVNKHKEIYKDVKKWLVDVVGLEPDKILRGYINVLPLPKNSVIMSVQSSNRTHKPVQLYDYKDNATIITGELIELSIDVYGENSQVTSDIIMCLWNSINASDHFKNFSPLYSDKVEFLPYIDEKNEYAQRYNITLNLQYNSHIIIEQEYVTDVNVNIHRVDK